MSTRVWERVLKTARRYLPEGSRAQVIVDDAVTHSWSSYLDLSAEDDVTIGAVRHGVVEARKVHCEMSQDAWDGAYPVEQVVDAIDKLLPLLDPSIDAGHRSGDS